MSASLIRFAEFLKPLPNPELRKDPIVGRWVIMATDRARRPMPSRADSIVGSIDRCPFCEGHEDATPGEIHASRDPGSRPNERGWRVRVVPNRFPALRIEGGLNHHIDSIYDQMNGVGAHEVIIECPHHEVSLANLPVDNIREVFHAYRERLVDLRNDRRLVYGMVFKNVGAAAGASLEHSHSQLILLPIVPINVQEEMSGSLRFFDERRECIYCHLIRQERAVASRLILETGRFAVVAPFASRFPFECWILPKEHRSHFETCPDEEIAELASVAKIMLAKLEIALQQPAYNYIIHTAPFDVGSIAHYHWHLEIIPRLTRMAGFEWGTGFYINPVPPEQAADFLRFTEIPTGQAKDQPQVR